MACRCLGQNWDPAQATSPWATEVTQLVSKRHLNRKTGEVTQVRNGTLEVGYLRVSGCDNGQKQGTRKPFAGDSACIQRVKLADCVACPNTISLGGVLGLI